MKCKKLFSVKEVTETVKRKLEMKLSIHYCIIVRAPLSFIMFCPVSSTVAYTDSRDNTLFVATERTAYVFKPGFPLVHTPLSVQDTAWLCTGTNFVRDSYRSIDVDSVAARIILRSSLHPLRLHGQTGVADWAYANI